MCLLVKVAPNTDFPREWFDDCYSSNPDGIGIAYVDPTKKRVVVRKALPASAKAAYNFWRKNAPRNVEYALHWRMRTHGAVDIDRVHPYHAGNGLYLMHNGVLSCVADDPHRIKSDTQIYAEEFGAGLGTAVFNPTVQRLIGKQIGSSNRFIFLHADHGMAVINESTGVTTERFPGCWFSNTYAWTPRSWGVENAWGGWSSGYVGGASGRHSAATRAVSAGSLDAMYGDVEFDWEGEPVGQSDSLPAGAQEEIQALCEMLLDCAKQAVPYDVTAQRFVNRFDSAAELEDFIRASYTYPGDALSDLQAVVEFAADGAITFAEIMEWFDIEALQEELNAAMDADAAAHIAAIARDDDAANDTYSG